MAEAFFKRTTFLVANAEESAKFYMHVFGMTKWYDNKVPVHPQFPPAAPPWAPCHLILLKADDPTIGMLGLMQYLDLPFDAGIKTGRTKVQLSPVPSFSRNWEGSEEPPWYQWRIWASKRSMSPSLSMSPHTVVKVVPARRQGRSSPPTDH